MERGLSGASASTANNGGDVVDFDFAADDAQSRREESRGPEPERDDGFSPAPQYPPRSLAAHAMAAVGRTLPHSVEAEEYLIAAMLIDGDDVLTRIDDAKISLECFYIHANAEILASAHRVRAAKQPVDSITVGIEVRQRFGASSDMWLHFVHVSGLIPTTAQVGYFIGIVREQALLREMIRQATSAVEDCYNYSGDIAAFAAEIEGKITNVTKRAQGAATWTAKSLSDFALPPAEDPSILLGKYRYLCRGGALVLVGTAGTGKSSAALQMAVCWALGRDFLGITCTKPLRSIIVQAEDDEGDVAEVWASISAALALTAEEVALVKSRVLIIEDRITSGAEFLSELKAGAARWKPDLVFLNPLLSFAGCAISEQEQMTAFLRNGLNRVNADKKWAYIVVHHTNKPPSQKDGAARNWNEYMYNMAGSAELPNWARAVITIEAKKAEGQFLFRLAKRGKRAGVIKEIQANPDEGEGAAHVEIVTKISAQHSSRKIQLPDGRSLQMMVWEPGQDTAEENDGKPERSQPEQGAGRKSKWTFADFAAVWPKGTENAIPSAKLIRMAMEKAPDMTRQSFGRLLKRSLDEGSLVYFDDPEKKKSGYYVPA